MLKVIKHIVLIPAAPLILLGLAMPNGSGCNDNAHEMLAWARR